MYIKHVVHTKHNTTVLLLVSGGIYFSSFPSRNHWTPLDIFRLPLFPLETKKLRLLKTIETNKGLYSALYHNFRLKFLKTISILYVQFQNS